MRSLYRLMVASGLLIASGQPGRGQEPAPGVPAETPPPAPVPGSTPPEGPPAAEADTKPKPPGGGGYDGDLFSRSRLSGDWWGWRSALAEKGLKLDLYSTQFYQGVAAGGLERSFEYGGKVDYLANLDAGKLGLGDRGRGFSVSLHAETRYGSDVNRASGLFAPANLPMSFPAADRSITSVTGLKFTQALGDSFAVFMGKINTLDEYPLRFSLGREDNLPGLGGFMNTSFVFNPIVGRTVPYSAAGVGGAYLKDGQPVFTLTVFDPTERATTGLDGLFDHGVLIVPSLTLRPRLFGQPGVYNFGGTYSNSKYQSVAPAAYLDVPPQLALSGRVVPTETGSWSLYANGYQSLWVDPSDEQRSWGPFAQFGLSDGNPNPIRYTAVAGVAGRSMIPGRTLDTIGVGYFYLGLSGSFKQLSQPLQPQRDESGVELFYNYAVTPWFRVTGDLQVARPSTVGFDTVVLAGLRLQILF